MIRRAQTGVVGEKQGARVLPGLTREEGKKEEKRKKKEKKKKTASSR
jgi:hypothetical protein